MNTRSTLVHCALFLTAGTTVALASPAPTPAAKGNVNGIDISISAASAGITGTKAISVLNTAAGSPATDYFAIAHSTTSCNPQLNNGAPSTQYPIGTSGIVAGSPFEMGDWVQMWEVANGRNGVSLGVSAGDRHPYIVCSVYRTNAAGRLEQLATSWAKHSFSAASQSQGAVGGANGQPACGTGSCSQFQSDNELEANCSDTYGSGLNSSPSYLGPRHEIAINRAMNNPGWHYQNSWFDNYTTSGTGAAIQHVLAGAAQRNDGIRSFNAGTIKAYQLAMVRRSELDAAALGTNGRAIFEAMYNCNGDNYYLNNIAHRLYTSTVTTGAAPATGSFTQAGPHTWGPASLQWGDLKSQMDPTNEGDAFVSTRVVDNGDGTWRYEYNVMNLSFDRQIDAFEVPVPPSVGISGYGFFQPRQFQPTYETIDASGNVVTTTWNPTRTGGIIRWEPPAATQYTDPQLAALNPPLVNGTVMNPNTIRWGTMYTFWFTATTGPRTATPTANLDAYRTGTFAGPFTAEVKAPRSVADMGIQGGTAGDDGTLDNNDFVAFIDAFFNNNMTADIGVQGGLYGHDAALDNNDFVVFIDSFFVG